MITRVETKGSYWELDDDLGRYRRWPKHEGPREKPEWGGPEAGALQDIVWHEMTGWEIRDVPVSPTVREMAEMRPGTFLTMQRLVVHLPPDADGEEYVVTAPYPTVVKRG